MTTTDFQAARHNMIENQIRCCKILDNQVLDLIGSMPREHFLPEHLKSLAYMEGRVPLPCQQEMLSPLQEASILQQLDLQGNERVLEIGSGVGFLTTMLAMQAESVVSCEIHAELAELARTNIADHGITNATVLQLNAMDPAAIAAAPELKQPFDVIVIAAATRELPEHIAALLNDGGRMIAFIGTNPVTRMVRLEKHGNQWQERDIFETLLQDIEGVPEQREFVF